MVCAGYFLNETAPCLVAVQKFGGYLGSSIDITPTIMAKIIPANGQVLYKSVWNYYISRWGPSNLADLE